MNIKAQLGLAIMTALIASQVICPAQTAGQRQRRGRAIALIPQPAQLERQQGNFTLTESTKIVVEKGAVDAAKTGQYLANFLRTSTGYQFDVAEEDGGAAVAGAILLTTKQADASLGKEGYDLEVTGEAIVIRANAGPGLFYGVQTLRQLLPPENFQTEKAPSSVRWRAQCVKIKDQPRFGWRGMHLDVSRHFFDVEFVKQYLDRMAMHKLNVFHWHLTDDDGWRIEVDKYPKLTEVGAWRGPDEQLPPSYESGDQRYGGFYTKEDIREIVAYAAERHILVVPEIDVPAHSKPLTVCYPELLCSGDPFKFKSVQNVPANVLCAGQESTYEFMANVLAEVTELFPGPYFHIGGDERPRGPWEQCEHCQKIMAQEKLENGNQLQNYFMKRMQDILRKHGKTMAGWDEIQHGVYLDKDYVSTAWHGADEGIAAAKLGYPVVMVPAPYMYFDLSYNRDPEEPGLRWAGVVSTEKAYSFEPVPESLDETVAKQIMGVEGALWSETLIDLDRPDYMLFPRLCALAEVGWTKPDLRKWDDFQQRMGRRHFARLEAAGIGYRVPLPVITEKGGTVTIESAYPRMQVRFTLDGSEPDANSTVFSEPIRIPKDGTLKTRTFTRSGRMSRTISIRQNTDKKQPKESDVIKRSIATANDRERR